MHFLRRDQQGSLLVEALVGVAILAVALVPIFSSFWVAPAAQSQAGRQAVALAIARSRLETLHALAPSAWDALASTGPTPDPVQPDYRVAVTVAPSTPGLKDVTVTVTWQPAGGAPGSVTLTTSVARRP